MYVIIIAIKSNNEINFAEVSPEISTPLTPTLIHDPNTPKDENCDKTGTCYNGNSFFRFLVVCTRGIIEFQ